jgi:hypothetical protein
MKALTLSVVLALSSIAAGASAAPKVHEITKAVGKQRCGEATTLTVSIVAPKGVHGTLRVQPVAVGATPAQVSYTGNGKTVTVPVTLPNLGCDDVAGIKLRLDDGSPHPKWLMPEEEAYGAVQSGNAAETHIQRVHVRDRTGSGSRFSIVLRGGSDGRNLTGTIRVKSVHSTPTGRSEERSVTYSVEAGRSMVHTFGHNFLDRRTLHAFKVYLNGATPPLVVKRVGVSYSL